VDPDVVRKALDRSAALVNLMHADNEVGTLQRSVPPFKRRPKRRLWAWGMDPGRF